MKKAVFPGSFDPITIGHCEIIEKACEIFDELIVSVGNNSDKDYKFSLDQRLKFISDEFKNNPKVYVEKYEGLTVDFCKTKNIKHIVRCLRNPADFEFEKNKGFPQQMHLYVPLVLVFRYFPLNGGSVPFFIKISNCSAVSFFPHSTSLRFFLSFIIPFLMKF